jgi:hypothetical protein
MVGDGGAGVDNNDVWMFDAREKAGLGAGRIAGLRSDR